MILIILLLAFTLNANHWNNPWELQNVQPGYNCMNLYSYRSTINGELLKESDEIAVFDGVNMVGTTKCFNQFSNDTVIAFIAAPDKDPDFPWVGTGFTEHNKISFKMWCNSQNIEIYPNHQILAGTDYFEISGMCLFRLSNIPASVKYNTNSSSVNIKPNPFNGVFELSFKSVFSKSIIINIIDSKGSVVVKESVESITGDFNKTISLVGLNSGVYFVVISSNGTTYKQKIVYLK